MLFPQTTINCNGRILDLSKARVMGILNITPDSFYDGGKYDNIDKAMLQVEQMLQEGVDIIDIGGMSSRPGADLISSDEECERIIPVIKAIKLAYPKAFVSVDTVYSNTVHKVLDLGIDIINDISAGSIDDQMFETVAKHQVPYILMHMKGRPSNMQKDVNYEDLITDILDFFIAKVALLRSLGCKDLIIDPGFGFGKSLTDNYRILNKMHVFSILDLPILTGVSRKSMITKLLNISSAEALNATSVLHLYALQQGSRILRVHDVKAAREVISLWNQLEGH